MFCVFLSLLSDTNVKTERANKNDILCILPMVTYVLTIRIAKQERKAHTMIAVACSFINIACVY
jgi:hypothetical protein